MREASRASSRLPRGRGVRSVRSASRGSQRRGAAASANTDAIDAGGSNVADDLSMLPPAFRQMIAEFSTLKPPPDEEPQRKRRRVGERSATAKSSEVIDVDALSCAASRASTAEPPQEEVQTLFNVDASSDDDSEDDLEWEDVPLPPLETQHSEASKLSNLRDIQVTLQKYDDVQKQRVARRKPATAAERQIRLLTHKMHLLCLLSHVQTRNSWCNDEEVQKRLLKILPRQCISFLNPKESLPQFTRSTTFADGLKQALHTFMMKYNISAPGLKKPHWVENPGSDPGYGDAPPMDLIASIDDFREKAYTLEGSRDLGAQLFCAMLRGAGVEARIVCSLQVLSFSGEAKGRPSLSKVSLSGREYIVIADDVPGERKSPKSESSSHSRSRLSQPAFSRGSKPPRKLRHLVDESIYPVFWVEAFNIAMQKWIPVDPLVTRTINKFDIFEPPLSDPLNTMSYVIAFEDDLSARDVTRRYTKSYCAKTRKQRIESTPGGSRWWNKVMRHFERPFLEDRDQLEIAELTAKAAAEPMPRNIQDFKDHPVYALERHLRLNEVIHPRREIGKVPAGKISASKPMPALEPVFRRGDVHICKSADGWYRLGRTLKVGEQPLKRVKPKAPSTGQARKALADAEEVVIPMYAEFQTEIYTPPPVIDGKVTKNAYGNIDVYVPSMVPEGGFHLKHVDAARAAKLLGIDYADAVTGFSFKGRSGTAVKYGVVAAVEYKEALQAVLQGFAQERIWEENERRRQLALGTWKEMLLKLRIRERVRGYFAEGELDETNKKGEAVEVKGEFENVNIKDVNEEAGGFLPDEDGGGFLTEPDTSAEQSTAKFLQDDDGVEDYQMAGRVIPKTDLEGSLEDEGITHEELSEGGGFLAPDLSTSTNEKYGLGLLHVAPPAAAEPSTPPPPATPSRLQATPRYNIIVTPIRRTESKSEPPGLPPETMDVVNSPVNPSRLPYKRPTPSTKPAGGLQRQGSFTEPIVVESSESSREVSARGSPAAQECKVRKEEERPEATRLNEMDDDSDDAYDQQSLISHDPADDDAEPEWLLSD
ncbi:Meiotic Sister-Chromatid recombination aldehyde dehydrogenase [Ascosphaera pollenicola]|nr:Meiotic Sister-Chromatid recombination aldehyde dehydrogenase [Ascosphaera pollenicola]